MTYDALIVDDKHEWASSFAAFLRRYGHMAAHEVVYNVSDAWRVLQQQPTRFDAVFLDIANVETPQFSSVSFLAEINRTSPHIPVIMITGSDEIHEATVHWGAAHYWQKTLIPNREIEPAPEALVRWQRDY